MKRYRMVFSGSGGQGVITAAIILAEAAVIYEDKIAVQSQSYGAAARGGATRSDIIISNTDINFPKVTQPNMLVSLNQESYNTFFQIIRPGGLLLTDSQFIKTEKKVTARQIELPMYDTIMKKIGNPVVFNICMLGAVVGITNIVKITSISNVLKKTIPEEFFTINQTALDIGMELGSKFSVSL